MRFPPFVLASSRSRRWLSCGAAVLLLIAIVAGGTLYLSGHSTSQADPGPLISLGHAQDGSALTAHLLYSAHGVPIVAGDTYADALAGLGYATAHLRLFQLATFRWMGSGQFASVFGVGPNNAFIGQDQYFATLDLPALALATYQRSSSADQVLYSAYAAGINAWLAQHPTLPRSFADLHITQIAPWQPQDCILVAMLMEASLDLPTVQTKVVMTGLAAGGGAPLVQALVPSAPSSISMFDADGKLNDPTTLLTSNPFTGAALAGGPSALVAHSPLPAILDATGLSFPALPDFKSVIGGPESNNWAVSGNYTASGKAILVNGPHLQESEPAFVLVAQISTPDFRLAGLTIPGLPGFISAQLQRQHGPATAWGVTYGMTDATDLFAEQVQGSASCASGKEAYVQSRWQCLTAREVTIAVAGAAPISMTVLSGAHGPILNAAISTLDAFGPAIALQTTVASDQWSIDGLLALPLATDESSFELALSQVGISLNWLYARGAEIGYHLSGVVPLRNRDNGDGIVSGADGAHDWQGYVQFSNLPAVALTEHVPYLNTSNNRLIPDDYGLAQNRPLYLSNFYDDAFRAQTVAATLNSYVRAGHKVTVSDMAALQQNVTSGAAQVFVPLLLATLAHAQPPVTLDAAETAALTTLRSWNGAMTAESAAAAIYEAWVAVLSKNLVVSILGANQYSGYASSVFVMTQWQAVYQQVAQPTLLTPTQRDAWVAGSLHEALGLLGAEHITTYGEMHRLVYTHPLATLDPAYAIGPADGFPTPGDPSTVQTGGWFVQGLPLLALSPSQLQAAGGLPAVFRQDAIDSGRFIADLGAPDRSLVMGSTGEDGEPGPHYSDMNADWRAGIYIPLFN